MLYYAEYCEPASLTHTLWGMNITRKCHPLKAASEIIAYSRYTVDVHVQKNAQIHNNYTKYGMNNLTCFELFAYTIT
jgi:hypothetical protein